MPAAATTPRPDTASRVHAILSDLLEVDPGNLKPDTRLMDLPEVDSLDTIEVVMALEETFGLSIDDAEMERAQTVADLIALVEAKRGERS